METEVKNANKTISNLDKKMDTLLERFDHLDKKYVTRREVNILKWLVAMLIAFGGLVADQIWR